MKVEIEVEVLVDLVVESLTFKVAVSLDDFSVISVVVIVVEAFVVKDVVFVVAVSLLKAFVLLVET